MAGMFIGPDPKNQNSSIIYACKNAIAKLSNDYIFIHDYDVYFIKYNKKMFFEVKLQIDEPSYLAHLLSNGITIENMINQIKVINNAAFFNKAELKIVIN